LADTQTPNYGWIQPEIGGDPTTWGNILNNDLALIDAQVWNNEQGVPPVGSGALWFAATPPANWLICDGSTVAQATYPLLYAAIGGAFNIGSVASGYFMLPNLQNAFPMGAGTLGAVGGEAAHILVAAEMPTHAHGVSDPTHAHGVYDPTHAHGAYQDAHNHSVSGVLTSPGAGAAAGSGAILGSAATSTAQPGVYVQAAGTGIGIDAAATGIGIQNAGGGAAHNTLPPYLQINFIIRYQ
jgi:microcystin-dependent protein